MSLLKQTTVETSLIVKARYSATMFKDMGAEELIKSAANAITDLKLLTGLKIPVDKSLEKLKVFVAESLRENYSFYSYPLFKIGLKKYAHILTSGDEKSYGRELSVADIDQVMNSFLQEVQDADFEINRLENETSEEKKLSHEQVESIIRKNIEETYQSGDFDHCTYVDFDQLRKDEYLSENSLKKNAWDAFESLKQKYRRLAESIALSKSEFDNRGKEITVANIAGGISKKKFDEKIQLLNEFENEIKAEVVKLFMQFKKDNGVKNLYEEK